VGPVTEQVVKGNDPHRGRERVCERDMARVRVGHGMSGQNYCVVGGCLISLTLCRFSSQILPRMDTPTILKFSHDSLTCL